MKKRKMLAVILAVMLAASCALLSACGGKADSENSGNGNETESSSEIVENGEDSGDDEENSKEEELNTETAAVTGKVYALCGMSSEDEDYDEQLIKDMFDIDDVGKYMSIYFEKGGTAYVDSLLYGKKVRKGKWGEKSDGITLLDIQGELYEIEQDEGGTISTTSIEDDGEGFLLTFSEPEKVPESLQEYVK